MNVNKIVRVVGILIIVAALPSWAHAGSVSPTVKCQQKKMKVIGLHTLCRFKEWGKIVGDGSGRGASGDLAKCDERFTKGWAAAEKKWGTSCPTVGDASAILAESIDVSNVLTVSVRDARFIDNGDGTVTDTRTRLMWEKKGSLDTEENLSDPHDVDNLYFLSARTSHPVGSIFTDFLARLNDCSSNGATLVGGFAGHCDWRLPNIFELIGILDINRGVCAGGTGPCIDPAFGPTRAEAVWSGTTDAGDPTKAWYNHFGVSPEPQGTFAKDLFPLGARAVRKLP